MVVEREVHVLKGKFTYQGIQHDIHVVLSWCSNFYLFKMPNLQFGVIMTGPRYLKFKQINGSASVLSFGIQLTLIVLYLKYVSLFQSRCCVQHLIFNLTHSLDSFLPHYHSSLYVFFSSPSPNLLLYEIDLLHLFLLVWRISFLLRLRRLLPKLSSCCTDFMLACVSKKYLYL